MVTKSKFLVKIGALSDSVMHGVLRIELMLVFLFVGREGRNIVHWRLLPAGVHHHTILSFAMYITHL